MFFVFLVETNAYNPVEYCNNWKSIEQQLLGRNELNAANPYRQRMEYQTERSHINLHQPSVSNTNVDRPERFAIDLNQPSASDAHVEQSERFTIDLNQPFESNTPADPSGNWELDLNRLPYE